MRDATKKSTSMEFVRWSDGEHSNESIFLNILQRNLEMTYQRELQNIDRIFIISTTNFHINRFEN